MAGDVRRASGRPGAGTDLQPDRLAIDAAVAGQGVALARSALAVVDLAAGRLLRPVPEATPAPFAYWILCTSQRWGSPSWCGFVPGC